MNADDRIKSFSSKRPLDCFFICVKNEIDFNDIDCDCVKIKCIEKEAARKNIIAIDDYLVRLLKRWKFVDDSWNGDLLTAVTELTTNIVDQVESGKYPEKESMIKMVIYVLTSNNGRYLFVMIGGEGNPIDVKFLKDKMPDLRSTRGRGVAITAAFSNRYYISTDSDLCVIAKKSPLVNDSS
ncbi:MAG: hypothetical protein V1838_03585 [Patescibacteria group bacterium]